VRKRGYVGSAVRMVGLSPVTQRNRREYLRGSEDKSAGRTRPGKGPGRARDQARQGTRPGPATDRADEETGPARIGPARDRAARVARRGRRGRARMGPGAPLTTRLGGSAEGRPGIMAPVTTRRRGPRVPSKHWTGHRPGAAPRAPPGVTPSAGPGRATLDAAHVPGP